MRKRNVLRAVRVHHIARPPTKMHQDAGFNLIEIIVTVAILATCVVALVTGIMAALSGTRQETTQATANTILRNYSQSIRAQMLNSCTGTGAGGNYATALTPAPPAGYNVSPAVGTSETCPLSNAAAPTPLTLTVTQTSGEATDSDVVWLWLP
jgi:prepilin-type N-terminal cleavage/methylation domain-containing protein